MAFGLVPWISRKGPADFDGKNSVVKMRVFFRSPPKKQAIYGVCASAPSKKRVKMQSQLLPVRVFFSNSLLVSLWAALGCFGLLWAALDCLGRFGQRGVALGYSGLLWAALHCFGLL